MNTKIKNAAIGLIALFAVTTAYPAMANSNYNIPAAEMKMVGLQGNQPLFQLSLNNSNYEEVVIVVKDESGYVLYRETLKGANLTRTFQLNTEDLEGTNLRIEVLSRNTSNRSTFDIIDNATVVLRSANK
jgi:hypothetical protein